MRRNWLEGRRKVSDEGRCRGCGRTDLKLDAAHIIPRSLGGSMAYDAIVPLCRNCHTAYDRHELDLLGRLSPAEEAIAVYAVGLESTRRRIAPSLYSSEPYKAYGGSE